MTRIALLSAALFLATACEAIPGLNMGGGSDDFSIQGSHSTDSFMTGRMTGVQGFDDDLSVNVAEIEADHLYIDLHAEGRYGWAMVGGDVDISGMEPGDSIELSEDELWSFVGCSGPQAFNYDFDGQPDSVTITLSEPAPADSIDVDVDAPDTDGVVVTIDADFGDDGGVTVVTTANRVPPQG